MFIRQSREDWFGKYFTHFVVMFVEGDRGAGARENRGREGYGRREKKGREAGEKFQKASFR